MALGAFQFKTIGPKNYKHEVCLPAHFQLLPHRNWDLVVLVFFLLQGPWCYSTIYISPTGGRRMPHATDQNRTFGLANLVPFITQWKRLQIDYDVLLKNRNDLWTCRNVLSISNITDEITETKKSRKPNFYKSKCQYLLYSLNTKNLLPLRAQHVYQDEILFICH